MVYQEDVSRVASALAGFSPAEADGLRKVLSKKDREHHLRDFQRCFVAGARRRGVGAAQIVAVWEMILSFCGYSFCKPHSASYARVSFQAAYLKVHHPAEFMAAVISNQGGFYSTFAYVSEARRMGLAILPPDVFRSEIRWTGRGNALRVGLLSVKQLGQSTRQRIVAERRCRPYKDLGDFLNRVRPDDDEARALVHAGALDRFSSDGHRGALLWEVARWQKAHLPGARCRSLFAGSAGELPRPVFPPQDARRRLAGEFDVLGFLCDGHPMALCAVQRRRAGAVEAVDLGRHVGRTVRFAGWLVTAKQVHTRQGEPMEFLTFEDETGLCEATFFPKIYRLFCHLLERGRAYLLTGRVEQDWGAVTLTVRSLEPMRSTILPTQDG
jgi:DNA polymerase-3 subunit alpha/error-prone DNA polymerase